MVCILHDCHEKSWHAVYHDTCGVTGYDPRYSEPPFRCISRKVSGAYPSFKTGFELISFFELHLHSQKISMPIEFPVAPFLPAAVSEPANPLHKPSDLLDEQNGRISNPEEWDCSVDPPPKMDIIQSSFKANTFQTLDIRSQRNGFVQTVTMAYNDHHHLKIRCVFTCSLYYRTR